jgi:hypothetical protein
VDPFVRIRIRGSGPILLCSLVACQQKISFNVFFAYYGTFWRYI